MNNACARREAFTLKRPWVLMIWDFGGWEIVKRSRTRRTVLSGWEHLADGDIPYAIAQLATAVSPDVAKCQCDTHREARKHFHPCFKGCEWMVACGDPECVTDLAVKKRMCRVCSFMHGSSRRRPPTEEELERLQLRKRDSEVTER